MQSPSATQTLRIYNAAASATGSKIDVIIDGTSVATGVADDVLSGPFMPKNPRSVVLEIRKTGTTPDLVDEQVDLASADHIYVVQGDPDTTLSLGDLSIIPVQGSGVAEVTFLNSSSGQLNVNIRGSSGSMGPASPVGNLGSTCTSLKPGSYQVQVSPPGSAALTSQSSSIQAKAGDRIGVLAVPGASGQGFKLVVVPC